ncbi:MAG: hypothetical protein R3F37_03195 [Candidatus Competibacteraceae bacterium]
MQEHDGLYLDEAVTLYRFSLFQGIGGGVQAGMTADKFNYINRLGGVDFVNISC